MNANYRFLGLLDSAKTAHYSSKAVEKDNWWIPDDEITWLMHTTSATALAMKQILWGEIITVPRNQYFDSPGWLNIADFFVKSQLPLFSICIHDPNIQLSPIGFVNDCANQFKNVSGSSYFAMSGWPGLGYEERQKIYRNIQSSQNFNNMFKDIKLDNNKKIEFHYQQKILQHVFEYLNNNYLKVDNLISRAIQPKTTLWKKIETLIENKDSISGLIEEKGKEFTKDFLNAFREIGKIARSKYKYHTKEQQKWLNQRSNLYQSIFEYDTNLREYLLRAIDKCYDETISESIASGRLGESDRSDSQIPFKQRDKYLDLIDKPNLQNGLCERDIYIPEEIKDQSNLIEKVVWAFNTPEFINEIGKIRNIRTRKGLPLDFVQEEETKHLDYLCSNFSNIIIRQSGKNQIIQYSYMGIKFGVKIVANHLLGSLLGDSTINPWVESLAGASVDSILEKALIKIDPIKEKVNNFIIYKDKEILVGRLRDWLTITPVVEEE